jgi:hypothetical protein
MVTESFFALERVRKGYVSDFGDCVEATWRGKAARRLIFSVTPGKIVVAMA